jgi:hypothetical protein
MKKPRLFYYEEDVNAFIPVPASVEGELLIAEDMGDDGEIVEIQFKRIDMTDEEYENLQ